MKIEKFKRRMGANTSHNSAGEVFAGRSSTISDKLFKNDPLYRRGMIYDWDLNPIAETDFKFEKYKSRSAEGQEVEYFIQFPTGFQPEHLYKDLYYKKDGRERYGFYIDVEDREKNIVEKWIIVNKDDRNTFDRYNVLRCNWMFEWIDKADHYKYHRMLGCIRDASDSTFSNARRDQLGGSTITGELSFVVPLSLEATTILVNQKFIISDNLKNPQTFSIVKVSDTNPLGVMRGYLKAEEFNAHTDYYGNVNEEKGFDFVFDRPLEDLPEQYGGPYHAICDCITSRYDVPKEPLDDIHIDLDCDVLKVFINGSSVRIREIAPEEQLLDLWTNEPAAKEYHLFLNDEEILPQDYQGSISFAQDDHGCTISVSDRKLAGSTIGIMLSVRGYYQTNTIELEVSR